MTPRTLLLLKRADIGGQFSLMAVCMWLVSNPGDKHFEDELFSMYFLVGGWQLCSTIATFFVSERAGRWKTAMRSVYNIILAVLAIIALIVWQDGDQRMVFIISFWFSGPLLAVFYFIISMVESSRIRNLQGGFQDPMR